MFKKSLTAVAVLGAFAGAAMASQVTMYGVVDTGLMYTYNDVADGNPATDLEVNKLALNSGINAASRFGLKGTEDLGNGLKIGFKLENGFKADDGTFKTAGRLFDREASLSVYSDFGTLSMGRMGAVGSSAGTYDIVYLFGDAFDGGDNEVFGFVTSGRADNMVTYQTPKFAGVQGTFQYSFNQDGQEGNKSSLNNQVFAAASMWSALTNIRTVALPIVRLFARMPRLFTSAAIMTAALPRPLSWLSTSKVLAQLPASTLRLNSRTLAMNTLLLPRA